MPRVFHLAFFEHAEIFRSQPAFVRGVREIRCKIRRRTVHRLAVKQIPIPFVVVITHYQSVLQIHVLQLFMRALRKRPLIGIQRIVYGIAQVNRVLDIVRVFVIRNPLVHTRIQRALFGEHLRVADTDKGKRAVRKIGRIACRRRPMLFRFFVRPCGIFACNIVHLHANGICARPVKCRVTANLQYGKRAFAAKLGIRRGIVYSRFRYANFRSVALRCVIRNRERHTRFRICQSKVYRRFLFP